MPTPRDRLSSRAVDGIIYAFGGRAAGNRPLSTVEAYDPATDTWTKKADMPTPRDSLSTSAVNGFIYAIGGWSGLHRSTVESYDTGVDIRVTGISPQVGLIDGGQSIAITGSGFPADAAITVGGNPVTNLIVKETLITGITPPGTAGEQKVLITASTIDFTVFAGRFFYRKPTDLVVTEITPTDGAQAGGNRGDFPHPLWRHTCASKASSQTNNGITSILPQNLALFFNRMINDE